MNKIVAKEHFSEKVVKLVVEAPLIARARKAGHFVIVRVGEKGERIPLTIASADVEAGTITLVVQAVGKSSAKLCALNPGDYITDVVGPLGKATHIERFGTVVCCGGGVGCAIAYPVLKKFHDDGAEVHAIVGFRSEDLVIPHVDMENRYFVLKPLSELAPNFRHPITHKTVAQMLAELPVDLTEGSEA